MQTFGDSSPSSITASVRRLAGNSGIGDLLFSALPESLPTKGSQGGPADIFIGQVRCRPSRKLARRVPTPPYGNHAQPSLLIWSMDVHLSQRFWNLASKPASDPRAQGSVA